MLELGKQIGAGAFGRVIEGIATGIVGGEINTKVAVKTLKPHSSKIHLKALMDELKILCHLGHHVNIVNLLGACTTHLHKRELLLIVEFCMFGNLHNFLIKHRHIFVDQVNKTTGQFDENWPKFNANHDDEKLNYISVVFENTSKDVKNLSHDKETPQISDHTSLCITRSGTSTDSYPGTVTTDMTCVTGPTTTYAETEGAITPFAFV